jgi:large subunit ribosomal protein L18
MKTNFNVQKRRKREGKTNYKKRIRLLMSNKTRLVVRPSNANMLVQFVSFDQKGDNTLASASSKELEKLGWKFSKSSLPAAYLTGLLAGHKAKGKGISEAVLDVGLRSPVKGSRIFACLKGAVDAGIDVPYSEEILPSEDRIKGKHIANYRKEKAEIVKAFEELKIKIAKVK